MLTRPILDAHSSHRYYRACRAEIKRSQQTGTVNSRRATARHRAPPRATIQPTGHDRSRPVPAGHTAWPRRRPPRHPPATAQTTLQSYIYRLRQLLRPLPGVGLETNIDSYMIEVAAAETDLWAFRGQVERARGRRPAGPVGRVGGRAARRPCPLARRLVHRRARRGDPAGGPGPGRRAGLRLRGALRHRDPPRQHPADRPRAAARRLGVPRSTRRSTRS